MDKYIEDVMKNINADKRNKRRIREGLYEFLDNDSQGLPYAELVEKHGSPEEMAEDFMDNLDLPDQFYGIVIGLSRSKKPYEFKSKRKIFGIPLVHINIGGRYKNSYAKGIIAIGDISVGVISFGGISFGLLSFGGIGAGVVSIASISAGVISLGVVSVGVVSIGLISVGTLKAIGWITRLI
jgi:hypothetical protein